MNTSTERVMATIEGKPKDQVATVLNLSAYGAGLIGCPLKEYYADSKLYAEGQEAVRDVFEPDIILAPFALALYGKAFGSEICFFEKHAPNIKEPISSDISSINNLCIPDTDSDPSLCYLRESVRRLASQSKGNYPIAAIALSPVDLPIMIFGLENWLEILLFEKKLAEIVLETSTQFFYKWTDILFSEGATCIVLPVTLINKRIATTKLLLETVLPVMKISLAKCSGPLILHHTGTSIAKSLSHMTDLPNTLGFCVGKEDLLSECRDTIGEQRLLLGNIDGPSLFSRSPDSIYNQTRKILDNRCDDKHFILATSAADIDIDTPKECIRAITNAVKEHQIEVAY